MSKQGGLAAFRQTRQGTRFQGSCRGAAVGSSAGVSPAPQAPGAWPQQPGWGWQPQAPWPGGSPNPYQPAYQPYQQAYQQPYVAAPATPPAMGLDERGRQALALVLERGAVGPTDLVQAFGSSAATWSRALSSLAAQGAVIKRGQKYQPTEFGRSLGGTL